MEGLAGVQAFLKSSKANGLVTSTVMARNDDAMKSIWFLREHISVALSKRGFCCPRPPTDSSPENSPLSVFMPLCFQHISPGYLLPGGLMIHP